MGVCGCCLQLDYGEKDSSYNRIKTLVNEELKQYFRPEFLNRLDEIIVFRQLTKPEVKEIADIMLKEVFERVAKKDIDLQVTMIIDWTISVLILISELSCPQWARVSIDS